MTKKSLLLFSVTEEHAAQRLDMFLVYCLEKLSRNRLKMLIKQGHIQVNNQECLSPNFKLKNGDKVHIEIPDLQDPLPKPQALPLDIIYEDNDLIVINKAAGMVVHPAAGNWSGTLVNALIYHCGDSLSGIGGVKRPGIVHRLDKETSGLMVVAKHDSAHAGLAEQFADHGREGPLIRAYKALIWGRPESPKGTINAALDRSSQNRLKRAVVKTGGKQAITHYEVLDTYARSGDTKITLVECMLETGRTHQIRVHMSHIGHPLLGDAEYGSGFMTKANLLDDHLKTKVLKLRRQALHAYKLGFVHPITGEFLNFESDFSKDLASLERSLIRNDM